MRTCSIRPVRYRSRSSASIVEGRSPQRARARPCHAARDRARHRGPVGGDCRGQRGLLRREERRSGGRAGAGRRTGQRLAPHARRRRHRARDGDSRCRSSSTASARRSRSPTWSMASRSARTSTAWTHTRARGQLMLYTPRFGPDSDMADTGVEWQLAGSPLRVVERRPNAGRTRIPADGVVLSFGGTVLPTGLERLEAGQAVSIETRFRHCSARGPNSGSTPGTSSAAPACSCTRGNRWASGRPSSCAQGSTRSAIRGR